MMIMLKFSDFLKKQYDEEVYERPEPVELMLKNDVVPKDFENRVLAEMEKRYKANEQKAKEKQLRKRKISRQLGMVAAVVAIIVMVTPLSGCVADTVKAAYHRVCGWAEERNEDGVLTGFEDVIEENDDTVGWIKIPNTDVDYPVVQTEDNFYYQNHSFEKIYDTKGTLFLDQRNKIEKNQFSKCTIIYGRNFSWYERIFGKSGKFSALEKYNDIQFYKENPILMFDTIYDTSNWVVFANFRVTTVFDLNMSDGTEEFFDNILFDYMQTDFENDEEFLTFVKEIKKRSFINTPIEINEDDDILLLSTASHEKKYWRLVIAARRVQDGEVIDVSSAEKNPNPLMPYDN